MAQVVQQRTPPYLLIIFAFLFLIATVVAVLFYMQTSDLKKEVAQLQADQEGVYRGDISRLRRLAETDDDLRDRNRTVVAYLESVNRKLTEAIAGSGNSDADAALQKVKALKEGDTLVGIMRPGQAVGNVGLVAAVEAALAARTKATTAAEASIAGMRSEMARLQESIASLQAEAERRKTTMDELEQARASAVATLETREKETDKKLEGIEDRYKQLLSERDKRNTELDAELAAQTRKLTEVQMRADALMGDVGSLRQEVAQLRLENTTLKGDRSGSPVAQTLPDQPGLAVDLAVDPDGKIMRVIEDEGLCYINLGSNQGIREYMPFAIYDGRKGIPTTGQNKGTLIVSNVSENVSECRIVTFDPNASITVGDVVANVAYDEAKAYTFFVYGDFDLSGKGRANALGRDEVKSVISRSGGKLADSLTVEVDFLVMGAAPAMPSKPREGADLNDVNVYQQRLKEYREYEEIVSLAQKMGIQVLNTNRFLAFTGYNPNRPIR